MSRARGRTLRAATIAGVAAAALAIVTATPTLQEIQANAPFTPGIDEAASTVTGVDQGQPVTGQAYVEQFGIWR